jgi:glyoxylase-like metal-dependent hydrolase (beta-lactamase superfamily II)
MFKVGDIEIHLINDCRSMADGGGPFGLVPKVLWQRYFTPTENNLIPMNHTCLFVKASGKNILVDVGYGSKLTDKAKRINSIQNEEGLARSLASLGIQPEDIDLVIDTHLHADHAAGNVKFKEGSTEEVEPVYPNAEYVVQKREYEDAMQPNERTAATYFPINYQPLYESGPLRLLEGDTEFMTGIWGIVTPGHTPGHMSVRFESGGESAMFLCDLATYAVHIERLGWMTSYDVEPLVTLETKRIWQKWALENDATLIFPHDAKRPIGKLRQLENGGIILDALDIAFVNQDEMPEVL